MIMFWWMHAYNWILAWTRRNACFSCILALFKVTWYLRKASYWIWKKFWLLSISIPQKKLRTFMFSMEWHSIIGVSLRILLYHGCNNQATMEDKGFWMDSKVPRGMGSNQSKLHGCTNLDFTSLGPRVPCSHRHL